MSHEPKDPKDEDERPEPVEPPRDSAEDPGDEDLSADSEAESDAEPDPATDSDTDADTDADAEPDIEILGYEALTEDGVSLGGSAEEKAAAEEHDIDLSEFDGAVDDAPGLEGELEAARSQTDELRREKAELEAEVGALRDQVRRTAADFENYRKRIDRDRKEERKQAAAGLVLQLLTVTDNFRRALEQAEGAAAEHEVLAGFVEGVRLIETQFFDILRAAGLEPVSAEGAFDPAVHEALMQEPAPDAPHMSILEVFEPGYLLGGRLLRPARVKVALNPGGVPAESETEDPIEDEDAPDRGEDGTEAPEEPTEDSE